MKLLAIETEIKLIPEDVKTQLLTNEAAAVLALKSKGVIKEIYFDEQHCAVILLECNSRSDAQNYLASLPLAAEGYIKFDITELKPYTGFDRLEKKDD